MTGWAIRVGERFAVGVFALVVVVGMGSPAGVAWGALVVAFARVAHALEQRFERKN